MIQILIMLATTVLSTSGCVVAYKTEHVVGSLNQSLGNLDQTFGQVDSDYREKSSLFERSLKDGGNRNEHPYKELSQSLVKMKASYTRISQERNVLIQDKSELEKKIEGKERVRSDEPAYKHLKATEKKWKAAFKSIEKEMKVYQSASQEFVQRAQEGGFRKVDTNALTAQANQLNTQYTSSIADVQSKLDQIRTQVAQQSAENRVHNLTLLSRAQGVFESIRKQEPEVRTAFQTLLSFLGPGQVLLVGPKSKSHAALVRLESLINQINLRTAEIQSELSQLKR